MPDFAINIGSRNEVLILNEYKGIYSIISGYEGRDGNNYFNMVFPRDGKTKEPRETAIPQKVTLGELGNAIGILQQFVDALKAKSKPVRNDPVTSQFQIDDDIPF